MALTTEEKLARSTYPKYVRLVRFINFLKHVKIGLPDDCWEWSGGHDSQGHGCFSWPEKAIYYAHVASYEFFIGGRHGKCVCHSCDNPPCVNPNHLWLGTQGQNIADMFTKGRNPSRKYEYNGRATITVATVKKIRKLYSTGKYSYTRLAKKLHITPGVVESVVTKRSWKDI